MVVFAIGKPHTIAKIISVTRLVIKGLKRWECGLKHLRIQNKLLKSKERYRNYRLHFM